MASDVHLSYQLRATRALVKFIHDHKGDVDDDLLNCLKALENKDIATAAKHAQHVKVSGMGSITDWFPPVVFPHETKEYVWAELEALANNWARLIALSFEKKQ
jgi:hypothetical protein